jgi:HK97 family phage portal protein
MTWLKESMRPEDRSLNVNTDLGVSADGLIPYSPYSDPKPVTPSAALQLADCYACVRCLADSISSLPLHAYRKTPQGRIPVGEDARMSRLLANPSPGSTGVDVISQIVVHLNVHGEAFVGKYRADGEIVQLGLLPPDQMQVGLRGQRIVYTLQTTHGEVEPGPEDVLHIKGMSVDGLRGLSPIRQCAVALGVSGALARYAHGYFERGARPSGILSVEHNVNAEALHIGADATNMIRGGVEQMHRIMVVAGDVEFTPVSFNADDSQFVETRELSTREIARIFRVPAWAIDGASGDSLTYANVAQQNRAFVDYSLRPWLRRVERAISSDPTLCPGGTYVEFLVDELLRGDSEARAGVYTQALNAETGWMRRDEVRELENLPPEEANA